MRKTGAAGGGAGSLVKRTVAARVGEAGATNSARGASAVPVLTVGAGSATTTGGISRLQSQFEEPREGAVEVSDAASEQHECAAGACGAVSIPGHSET